MRLEENYPDFLCRSPKSNFMKFNKVINKNIEDLLSVQKQVQNYFSLNKKIQIWKEQKEPYKYVICFCANYEDIENIKIYKNNTLIYTESNIDNFFLKINEESSTIVPDLNIFYKIIIKLKTGETLKKGFPENADFKNDEFDHDKSLDVIGKLLDCHRRIYKTNINSKDYQYTEPPFCNFSVESDHDYMTRLKEYMKRYWKEPLVCLKIWQYYNLNSKLVNRSELLCTIGKSYIGADYIATKQNYNAYCYDLIIDSESRIPLNLIFTNMAEVQKLVNKYTPLTKRVFLQYQSGIEEMCENIYISTQLDLEKNNPINNFILNIHVLDKENTPIPALCIIEDKRIDINNEEYGSIKLPEKEYSLVILPYDEEKYLMNIIDINLNKNMDVTIILDDNLLETFNVNCYVLDQDTKNGVKVTGYVDDPENPIISDENGYFNLLLTKEEHDFVLNAENYRTLQITETILNDDDLTFLIKHDEYVITFSVVDAETLLPVPSANISINNLPEINTNSEGQVNAILRKNQQYGITVNATNYEKYVTTIDVTQDENIILKINKEVPKEFSVVCYVKDVDTHLPVPKAYIFVDGTGDYDGQSYTCDVEGKTVIQTNVGEHRLKTLAADYHDLIIKKTVKYPPEEIVLEIKKIDGE